MARTADERIAEEVHFAIQHYGYEAAAVFDREAAIMRSVPADAFDLRIAAEYDEAARRVREFYASQK